MDIVLTIAGIASLAMEYYIEKNKERFATRKPVLFVRWIAYSLVAVLFMLHPPRLFVLPALLFLAIINIREDLRSRNLFSSVDYLVSALIVSGAGEMRCEALMGIAFSLIVNGVAYWSGVIGEGDLWSGVSIGAALGINASYVFWCVIAVMVVISSLLSKRKEVPLAILLYPTAFVFVLALWLASV